MRSWANPAGIAETAYQRRPNRWPSFPPRRLAREPGRMQVESLHDDFGARIHGVDLTGPLPPTLVEQLHLAIDEHSVLVFPDQAMNDEAQLVLTQALCEPEESLSWNSPTT